MSRVTKLQKARSTLVKPIGTLRVVFYCRVSTDEQEERGTIESQRSYLHERYRVDFRDDAPAATRMQLVGEYSDDGYSGAKPLNERPGARQMMEDAAAGKFDVVIVYKVDRLGRSVRVLVDAHDELELYGVAITSATEPFDTRPGPQQAIGKFVFQLLGSIAELERSTIKMRTMDGKHRVAKEGKFINGTVPFGFEVDNLDHLVPSQILVPQLGISEGTLVHQIFERVAAGQSCYSVADWLTKSGVASTRRMFNKEHRRLTEAGNTSPVWGNRRVWETIRNPVYKGVRLLSFDQREMEQSVAPIVSESLWDMANAQMKVNNRWDGRNDSYVYLLSKKLHCTGSLTDGTPCGYVYTGGISNGIRYYSCNGNDAANARRRGSRCGSASIRTDKVEPLIWEDLAWVLRHPDEVMASLTERIRDRADETSAIQTRLHDLLRRRTRVEATATALHEQLKSGHVAFAEAQDVLAGATKAALELDTEIAEVTALLDSESIQKYRLTETVDVMRQIGGQLDDIERSNDRVAMRRLIDLLVEWIRVDADGNLHVQYTFRTGKATSTVSSSTNIQTVVVGQTTPESRPREIA